MPKSKIVPVVLILAAGSLWAANKFNPTCTLPSPLSQISKVHPVDKKCSADGKSKVAEKIAESRAKNNYCASGSTAPIVYDAFLELQAAVEKDVQLGNGQRPPRPTKRYPTKSGTLGEGDKVRYASFTLCL